MRLNGASMWRGVRIFQVLQSLVRVSKAFATSIWSGEKVRGTHFRGMNHVRKSRWVLLARIAIYSLIGLTSNQAQPFDSILRCGFTAMWCACVEVTQELQIDCSAKRMWDSWIDGEMGTAIAVLLRELHGGSLGPLGWSSSRCGELGFQLLRDFSWRSTNERVHLRMCPLLIPIRNKWIHLASWSVSSVRTI